MRFFVGAQVNDLFDAMPFYPHPACVFEGLAPA